MYVASLQVSALTMRVYALDLIAVHVNTWRDGVTTDRIDGAHVGTTRHLTDQERESTHLPV